MSGGRHWTIAEIETLRELWGDMSIPAIGARLGRSAAAVQVQARRLGLGAVLESGDYVTLLRLLRSFNGTETIGSAGSWLRRGLPVHRKKVNRCSFQVVQLREFWPWAFENRSFLDFSKLEPLVLGQEPDWVPEQRKLDFQTAWLRRTTPWTGAEDTKLRELVRKQEYTWPEVAGMLNRTEGAVQRRLNDLKIRDRPLRGGSHDTPWTGGDLEALEGYIREGWSYPLMSRILKRSEKSIRGKVGSLTGTEDLDKARRAIDRGA